MAEDVGARGPHPEPDAPRFDIVPGLRPVPDDVRRFADTTRFDLRPAAEIAGFLPSNGPDEGTIDCLLRQLEVGLSGETLPLPELPVTLNRGEYLALSRTGVRTANGFWELSIQWGA